MPRPHLPARLTILGLTGPATIDAELGALRTEFAAISGLGS